MPSSALKIGDLARLTGVTVRALHHYDEVGLLVPQRGESGHRLYRQEDVRRLYRILALRSLGLGLDEVATCLAEESEDLRPTVRRQLEALDRRLADEGRLRERLAALLGALDQAGGGASLNELTKTIEEMTMIEKHYTDAQLATLERRRQAMGEDGMRRAQDEWAGLISELDAERRAGTDPGSARVQALAERWHALVEQFTGGDPGIRASLQRMYEQEGVSAASRGAVSEELAAYTRRARRAGSPSP